MYYSNLLVAMKTSVTSYSGEHPTLGPASQDIYQQSCVPRAQPYVRLRSVASSLSLSLSLGQLVNARHDTFFMRAEEELRCGADGGAPYVASDADLHP